MTGYNNVNALRLIKARACSIPSLDSFLLLKWRSDSTFQHLFNIPFVLSLIVLFAMLSIAPLAFAAALEFSAGDGNPTGNGPTQSTTIRLRHNTDDPSGNTFVTYNPSLTATIALSNQQYMNHPQDTDSNIFTSRNPANVTSTQILNSAAMPRPNTT